MNLSIEFIWSIEMGDSCVENKSIFGAIKKDFLFFSHTLQNLNDWTIQLGMTRRHSHAHYGQRIKVKKVIPHPQYSQYVAHDNDIALFQVIEIYILYSITYLVR
jgi:hypothetical protein